MIVSLKNLSDIRREHPDQKIVLTSGTFDLFHVGHLDYLQTVKTYGDIIIVILSGDKRVIARKGLSRPIIPESERAEIIDALKVVDFVFIDPSKQPPDTLDPIYQEIVNELQPDLYVTDGEDIRFLSILDKSKQFILPRKESGKYGSTTEIIRHISDKK